MPLKLTLLVYMRAEIFVLNYSDKFSDYTIPKLGPPRQKIYEWKFHSPTTTSFSLFGGSCWELKIRDPKCAIWGLKFGF